MTGSDDILARDLYKTMITFWPQGKLMMLTNVVPDFNIRDQAMLDRVKLVPFHACHVKSPDNTQFCQSLTVSVPARR